jgi:hypothetical protein
MSRSEQYIQGRRAGVKWAITWLHGRAKEMNDPHAKTILDTAAFQMGVQARSVDVAEVVESIRD